MIFDKCQFENIYFLLDDERTPLGTIAYSVHFEANGNPYIDVGAILVGKRSPSGTGLMLFEQLEKHLPEKGNRIMGIHKDNHPMRKLAQRAGYLEIKPGTFVKEV